VVFQVAGTTTGSRAIIRASWRIQNRAIQVKPAISKHDQDKLARLCTHSGCVIRSAFTRVGPFTLTDHRLPAPNPPGWIVKTRSEPTCRTNLKSLMQPWLKAESDSPDGCPDAAPAASDTSGLGNGRSLMLAMRRRINPCSSNSSSHCHRSEPMAGVVVPLVGKPHGDSVPLAGPKLFDQTVIQLFIPLTNQELHDGVSTGEKLGTITHTLSGCKQAKPARARVCSRHPLPGGLSWRRIRRRTAETESWFSVVLILNRDARRRLDRDEARRTRMSGRIQTLPSHSTIVKRKAPRERTETLQVVCFG